MNLAGHRKKQSQQKKNANSSVARGAGGYIPPPPPIGMLTKMQIKKNTTFLKLLRLFYALEWIQIVI